MSYNPNQQQIEFFWPLTEQIPLDLNYEGCARPVGITTVPSVNGSTSLTFNSPAAYWSTTLISDEVDTKKLSIVLDKRPNFVVRWLYKLLNINWKI